MNWKRRENKKKQQLYLNTIIPLFHLLIILAITISTNKKEIIFEEYNKEIAVNKVNHLYVLQI